MKFLPHKIIIATLLLTSIGQVYAKGDQRGERPQRPSFSSIDTNEDGEISLDEFKEHELPMGDHETIFEEMDSDGNNAIDEDEFDSHKPPRRR
ncbi:EF-hand domain-containing protein [Pseudocolwellia sp. HL-MZ19]|uniref:EF-hand domain-containing protein n=1 Tax=unclassified Pseudocolwellia TaxID=2848178 RepID=UPI003CE7795B